MSYIFSYSYILNEILSQQSVLKKHNSSNQYTLKWFFPRKYLLFNLQGHAVLNYLCLSDVKAQYFVNFIQIIVFNSFGNFFISKQKINHYRFTNIFSFPIRNLFLWPKENVAEAKYIIAFIFQWCIY